MEWQTVLGPDLDGPSCDQLPEVCAVYIWRRRIAPPPGVLERKQTFVDWLRKELETPYCTVEHQELTPYLRVDQLTVGGRSLDEHKRLVLNDACDDRGFRLLIGGLVQSASKFAPALYVGKADNLRKRIGQHVRGETEFSSRLQLAGLDWADLTLQFRSFQDVTFPSKYSSAEVLEMLESILTGLSVATMVARVG